MFRPAIFAFLVVVLWSIPAAAEPDPRITGITDQVSVIHLEATVRYLEAYGTRYAFSDSTGKVANWLAEQFKIIGYSDVRLDTFSLEGIRQRNVVVTRAGGVAAGEEVVLGAHYDSIVLGNVDPRASAPGANDNATGVAAVLEISRILWDIPLDRSVRFVLFAAEELGLYGSADYARKARNRGDDIRLMLNLDEIGYNPEQFAGTMLVLTGFSYLHFGEITVQAMKEYGGLTPLRLDGRGEVETWDCRCSDHQSFLDAGYPAVLLSERDPVSYPYGHTIFDRIEKVDLSLVTGITKGALATTIMTAGLAGETVVERAGWGEIKKRTLERWNVKR